MSDAADPRSELRKLATILLAVLDPSLQAAMDLAPSLGAKPSACQQPWCPLCAAVAVTSGESHPFATMIAEHGVALIAIVREFANANEFEARPSESPGTADRFEHIPVTIHQP